MCCCWVRARMKATLCRYFWPTTVAITRNSVVQLPIDDSKQCLIGGSHAPVLFLKRTMSFSRANSLRPFSDILVQQCHVYIFAGKKMGRFIIFLANVSFVEKFLMLFVTTLRFGPTHQITPYGESQLQAFSEIVASSWAGTHQTPLNWRWKR